LGISEKDEIEIIENVNIIFHCAARAKFSLSLREALTFNTLGTWRLLKLAEKIKNLIVFSHFSTVYCNPNDKVLNEKYTPSTADPYEVMELLTSSNHADLDDAEAR
jgi:fatty acyl-CoA reductase